MIADRPSLHSHWRQSAWPGALPKLNHQGHPFIIGNTKEKGEKRLTYRTVKNATILRFENDELSQLAHSLTIGYK